MQNDPDTSELHFALGNLFRRRGEYDRAVRVHEHLLSRGDLGRPTGTCPARPGLDFLKADLLDRAEDALNRLGTPFEPGAAWPLLAIYERSRDWSHAASIAQKCMQQTRDDFEKKTAPAHYLCEASPGAERGGSCRRKALLANHAAAPDAAGPALVGARLQQQMGQPDAVLDTLRRWANRPPPPCPLAARCWWRLATPLAARPKCMHCCAALREIAQPGCSGLLWPWKRQRRHPSDRACEVRAAPGQTLAGRGGQMAVGREAGT